MEGLTEGRIVHYVMPNGEHRPAIVVKIWRVPDSPGPEPILKAPENGCCNLQVFTDGSNDTTQNVDNGQSRGVTIVTDAKNGIVWRTSVTYSEEPTPGAWHWIEQA